jgi:ABC-type phosphate transport system substrate-binding protein
MLVRGEVAAAVVHRRASPEELRDASGATIDAYGLEHVLLARDSIALAVHTTNPLHAVTRDEARKLILGEMTWADFPGPPPIFGGPALALPEGPPTVYLRGPPDSSRRALSLLQVKTAAVSVSLGSDEAVVDSLVEDPAGLAIVPVSALRGLSGGARGKVLGLQQNGTLIFTDAGRKGGPIWPLLRPLYLVRLSGSKAFEPLVRAATSPKGKQVTAAAGFLPASPVVPKRRGGAP